VEGDAVKRIEKLHVQAQESSLVEFIHSHPHPVLVVLQIHEGNLVRRPPDHEATVSHRRLPWAESGFGGRKQNRKGKSLGHAARATMHHEGNLENAEISLSGLFEDSPTQSLPELGATSRFVTLHHALESANPNLVIGRSSTCDVVINDYSVSKTHARITHDDRLKRTMVTDLGSRNGTFMDEHRLEEGRPSLIRSGDEIRLGRLNFVYLEPSELYRALQFPEEDQPTVS